MFNVFPYLPTVPPDHCELCQQASDVLSPVTIEPARKIEVQLANGAKVMRWRLARVVMACGRHTGANGDPITTPNTTMLRGTSRLKPQELRLFDRIPYRKAGEAERRWTQDAGHDRDLVAP